MIQLFRHFCTTRTYFDDNRKREHGPIVSVGGRPHRQVLAAIGHIWHLRSGCHSNLAATRICSSCESPTRHTTIPTQTDIWTGASVDSPSWSRNWISSDTWRPQTNWRAAKRPSSDNDASDRPCENMHTHIHTQNHEIHFMLNLQFTIHDKDKTNGITKIKPQHLGQCSKFDHQSNNPKVKKN